MKSPIGITRNGDRLLLHLPGAGRLCINLSQDEAKAFAELVLDAVKPEPKVRHCSYNYDGMSHKSHLWVCVRCGHSEGMGGRLDKPHRRICDQQEETSP